MAGTIERLKSGSWRITVEVAGRRTRRTVSKKLTRRQVELALAALVTDVGGQPTASTDVTLGELLDIHLTQHTLAATTRADYLAIIDRLPDDVGETLVAKVNAAWLETLQARLMRAGWSAHRIARLRDVLGPALNRAVRWEWLRTNPLDVVPAPVRVRPDVHAPPPETIARLLAASIHDPEWYLWLHLDAMLGARRGEVCGVQWGDVDFDRGTVSIRRAVAYTVATGVVVKPTKTGKARVVSITLPTAALLRSWRSAQARSLLEVGVPLSESTFLFASHPEGILPWRPDRATQRFGRLCKQQGIEGVRLHDLRHAAATQLLGAGFDVVTVAARLGHASPSTTLSRYAHAIPAKDVQAAEALDGLYGVAPPS